MEVVSSLNENLFFFNVTFSSRDAQTRQLQDAVTNVEKHFGELCQIFAAYVRKTARLRDKADLLVNEINIYASTETPHLKQGLKNFADEFAKLQDYRQAEVRSEVTASLGPDESPMEVFCCLSWPTRAGWWTCRPVPGCVRLCKGSWSVAASPESHPTSARLNCQLWPLGGREQRVAT